MKAIRRMMISSRLDEKHPFSLTDNLNQKCVTKA